MRSLAIVAAVASLTIAAAAAGCSSNGTTCTVSNDGPFATDGGSTFAACDTATSGDGGARDGSLNGGRDGGSFGDGGTIGPDAGGGGGGGGGGIACNPATGDPDFCMCSSVPSSQSNATACSSAWLRDKGACCADPGWPQSGSCICSSFLCEVNQGGGRDCFFSGSTSGLGTKTSSATGAACCLRGQGICSCYDANNAGSCNGFTKVSSCTFGVVPPCTDSLSQGDRPVSSCR